MEEIWSSPIPSRCDGPCRADAPYEARLPTMKTAVSSTQAPSAIGPYSQAVVAEPWVFLSGQIPLDPQTGELVAGTIEAQTDRVLRNLSAVLAAAGCGFADVVRTTIYLVDLAHFATVNAVYGRFFADPYPARSTVQVAALPRGAHVEIDAVALKPHTVRAQEPPTSAR
jgi:2-iminobutanoate/2-iminopropanoate deaminase